MTENTEEIDRQILQDVSLYEAYRKARAALPLAGRFMPYNWENLPEKLSGIWMAYAQMLGEFSSELANTINGLTNHVHRLQAWAKVVETLDDDGKMQSTHEFIDVLATNAVNLPYVIKSRFAFVTAHLCHQANMTRDFASWQDDLPLDVEIDLNTSGIRNHKSMLGNGSKESRRHRKRDIRHGLDHIAIQVADAEGSARFYKDVFGLIELKNPFVGGGGVVWLDLGNGIALHIFGGRQFPVPKERERHMAFTVSDISKITTYLQTHGMSWQDFDGAVDKIQTRPDGVHQLFFKDLDGYWIEVNDALGVENH